jgi:tetratricopeptide (TPR) repeat protein
LVLTFGVLLYGCGASRAAEEVDRSMREFQLAASLRDEGNVPGALQHLATSLELDPQNGRAHLLLGYIHMGREEYADAERHLRTGIGLLTDDREAGTSTVLAEARNMLGVVLIRQGKHGEAVETLEASAKDALNTAPFYAWGNLGLAYSEQGNYDAAIRALTEAVQIQPRFCLGHYLMGKAYFQKDEFSAADDALTMALEVDQRCEEHFQEAWRLRGETRARLGRRDDAISDFERCAALGDRTESGQACKRFLRED